MHDEHSHTKSELWLARQLRDAARREAPAFSESLHQRIMQAVQPTAAELSVAPPTDSRNIISRRRSSWRTTAWLTAAAAAIFAMVIAARQFAGLGSHIGSQPAPIQAVVVVPSKSIEAVSGGTGTDDVASQNYTLDDLTRDAQATAHLLVDQLPFETPADEWGL